MDLFKHGFDDLTEKDIRTLKEYFGGFDYRGAGFTFLANYIWRESFCFCWERIGEYLLLAGTNCMSSTPEGFLAMPLTRDGTYDPAGLRDAVLAARDRFRGKGMEMVVYGIPAHLLPVFREAFPTEMEFEHSRDYDEYVYEKEKLMYLSGRALHKKKNHLNYFYRNYRYQAKPLTRDMLEDVLKLTDQVKEARAFDEEELASLESERLAIKEFMEYLDEPDVYSTGIFIKGKLEAYALGERISKDTAVEHFEKANDQIRGLYQAICSEFCMALPEDIVFVNREEDMGLDNLRQAKEALKPHHMEEKYRGCFLGLPVVE